MPSLVRVLLVTLIAFLQLACDGDAVAPSEPATFALDESRAADFRVAVEGLQARVLPHVEQSAQAGLPNALEGLADAIETRSADDLERALSESDGSLAELDAGAIAPDLEAVRLVLLQARRLLDSPPAEQ